MLCKLQNVIQTSVGNIKITVPVPQKNIGQSFNNCLRNKCLENNFNSTPSLFSS